MSASPVLVTTESAAKIESQSSSGSFFKNIRATGVSRVNALPMVTSQHELWRYTKPSLFPFATAQNQSAVTFALHEFTGSDTPGAALAPTGVSIATNPKQLEQHAALLANLFDSENSDLAQDPVAALQQAVTSSFCVIHVAKNTTVEKPLLLSKIVPTGEKTCAASLVVISVERDAQVTIVDDTSGCAGAFLMPRVEIVVGDNASVRFVSVQRADDSAVVLARHRFHTGKDSRLKTVHLAIGAKVSRVDIDLRMLKPGADIQLLGISLADGKRHVDLHPTQFHLAPHCRSDLFMKGVQKDNSRSVYYGYIRVAEGAQKTDAYQTNRNIVLSPTARADTIPNLEIKANDVRCSHGASVTHINVEDMFYLRARGLNPVTAEQLLVEGFLEDLLVKIDNELLHGWLNGIVMERIQRGTPHRKTN